LHRGCQSQPINVGHVPAFPPLDAAHHARRGLGSAPPPRGSVTTVWRVAQPARRRSSRARPLSVAATCGVGMGDTIPGRAAVRDRASNRGEGARRPTR
jgi:hypothetical protein